MGNQTHTEDERVEVTKGCSETGELAVQYCSTNIPVLACKSNPSHHIMDTPDPIIPGEEQQSPPPCCSTERTDLNQSDLKHQAGTLNIDFNLVLHLYLSITFL